MKTNEIYTIINNLKLKFYQIQCKNWIQNKSNGTGACGRTFEILLKKNADRFILPDYHGIEIKTQLENSPYKLSLFSMAFDNKPLEMQRLLKIGGYPDRNHSEFNVFNINVSATKRTRVGYRRSYQLKVDYKNKVIRLFIFDFYDHVIDSEMSWSFHQLKERLEHKLKYMAYIPTRRCKVDGKWYFKYLDIYFYALKDFDAFLDLVQTGIISVSFKLNYYKSGEHYGEILDHGTTFQIDTKDLNSLFTKLDI